MRLETDNIHSGKTFTLMGDENEPGIVPRAIKDVFGYIRNVWSSALTPPLHDFDMRTLVIDTEPRVSSASIILGNLQRNSIRPIGPISCWIRCPNNHGSRSRQPPRGSRDQLEGHQRHPRARRQQP